MTAQPTAIATANEGPLHAALKEFYARGGGALEEPVDGRQIDVVRDGVLYEIQTGGLSPIVRKLAGLCRDHDVRAVIPMARQKWIVRLDAGGGIVGRRRSPKRLGLLDAFDQLVFAARLLNEPRFAVDLAWIDEEEVRQQGHGRNWRRKGWGIVERGLLAVHEVQTFHSGIELRDALLPDGLAEPFTTADMAEAVAGPRWLAQKAAYCLRESGAIEPVGRGRGGIAYRRARDVAADVA